MASGGLEPECEVLQFHCYWWLGTADGQVGDRLSLQKLLNPSHTLMSSPDNVREASPEEGK